MGRDSLEVGSVLLGSHVLRLGDRHPSHCCRVLVNQEEVSSLSILQQVFLSSVSRTVKREVLLGDYEYFEEGGSLVD